MEMDLDKVDSDMQSGNKPFLAIWMVTYNHQNSIEQALNSILEQQTNFKFKVFIGEDNSTDDTLEVINRITFCTSFDFEVITHPINIGPNANALQIYSKCFESGAKYVAMLEGDDYWTDPYKLQKQVDFLEKNPDYSICFHPINVLKDGKLLPDNLKAVEETTTIEDLAQLNYIHTPSVVFRNNLFEKFPESFQNIPAGDYFLHMLNARYGKIKKLPDVMAVYRMHDSSVWSNRSQLERELNWVKQLTIMQVEFRNDTQVREILDEQMKEIMGRITSKIEQNKVTSNPEELARNVQFKTLVQALKNKITNKLRR